MYLPWIMQPTLDHRARIVALDTATGLTHSEGLLSLVSANDIRNARNQKTRAERLFQVLRKEGPNHA